MQAWRELRRAVGTRVGVVRLSVFAHALGEPHQTGRAGSSSLRPRRPLCHGGGYQLLACFASRGRYGGADVGEAASVRDDELALAVGIRVVRNAVRSDAL